MRRNKSRIFEAYYRDIKGRSASSAIASDIEKLKSLAILMLPGSDDETIKRVAALETNSYPKAVVRSFRKIFK